MLTGGAFGYPADYALWWLLCLSLIIHTWCFFRFFPKDRYRKSGLVVGNALVLACLLGVASLIGESYYRFLCVETDAFGMSLPAQRWFVLHTKLNSHNFRDAEWTVEKPPGVRRIAFVGDSFTYGWGIEREENRFPDRIEAMFNDADPSRNREGAVPSPRVEVMNVAKPGWDTGAQLAAIREMISVYGWDEVILCYVPNDIEELLPRSETFDPISPPQPRLFNPTTSCLFEYLYYHIWVPRVATVRRYHDWLAAGFADESIWQEHLRQLSDIIRECHGLGVTLRVVLLPFLRVNGQAFQPERIHAMLRGFFESEGVEVLDLLPVVAGRDPSDLTVSRHDAHPNEHAHALYAEAIGNASYHRSAR